MAETDATLRELLLRARDAWTGLQRWSLLAVLALLAIDLGAVLPFVQVAQEEARAQADVERLTQIQAASAKLAGQLTEIRDRAKEATAPILDQLVADLTIDLRRVEATRQHARQLVEALGLGAGEAEARASESVGDGEVQPFDLENPDTIVALAKAKTRDEIVEAVEPVIEERVVRPRFDALDRAWKANVLPGLEARLDAIASEVPSLRGQLDEADDDWTAFAEALNALRRAARDVSFKPPERRDWWASSDPSNLALEIESAVAQQLRQPLALDQLDATIEKATSCHQKLIGRLDQRQSELEQDFSRTTTKSNLGPLAWTGLDLPTVAAVFPLILGLILAGSRFLLTRGWKELALLTRLLIEEGDAKALRHWLVTVSSTGRGFERRLAAVTVVQVAWIGVHVVQQLGAEGFDLVRSSLLASVGIVAVVAASVHAGVVTRSMVRPSGSPEPKPAPAPVAAVAVEDQVAFEVGLDDDEGEGEEEVLDGHPLQR